MRPHRGIGVTLKQTGPRLLAAILGVAAFLFLTAFNLEPITADLEPSGPGSVVTLRLSNPSTDPVAVRIQVLTRREDSEGRELNVPAEALFTVYPSRVVLGPKAIQLVRVQWKGDPNPAQELAFRLLVEQLPVDFGENKRAGGSIRILTRYVGSLYVLPPQAKPDIRLTQFRAGTDKEGRKGLYLEFQNLGTAHSILADLRIELSAGGQKVVFEGEPLKGIDGENLLAGSRRNFFIPLPPELQDVDPSALTVNFQYEAVR